jgi:hypothetical protein
MVPVARGNQGSAVASMGVSGMVAGAGSLQKGDKVRISSSKKVRESLEY